MSNIIMILDESGSMDSIRHKIIASVNEFIVDQQKTIDSSMFTLVTFNDRVTQRYVKYPLADIPCISEDDYKPHDGTALNQAIVETIDCFRDDQHVIMVVVTDGQENASKPQYTRQSVFDKISDKKDAGWKFIYLLADIDTFTQGQGLGFGSAGFSDLTSDSCNVAVGFHALSENISTACSAAVTSTRLGNVFIGTPVTP